MLGSHTPEQRNRLDAAEYARRNRDTRPDDSTINDARARGRLLAIAARDRTDAWSSLPEVAQAMEQARLNAAVDIAASQGDPIIRAALQVGDTEQARAVILAREEQERRQQEEQERHLGIHHGPGRPEPSGGGSPQGPRSPR